MAVGYYPDIDQRAIRVHVASRGLKCLEIASGGLATIDVAHALISSNVLQGGLEQINALRVGHAELNLQEWRLSGARAKQDGGQAERSCAMELH